MTTNQPMKPLLAAALEAGATLTFPVMVSTKLDGVRALTPHGTPQTRSGKPLPNLSLQALLAHPALKDLDGELLAGEPNAENVFARTSSIVMSHHGDTADVRYFVFDCIADQAAPFAQRLEEARRRVESAWALDLPVVLVEHVTVQSQQELDQLYLTWLDQGYEGAMVRKIGAGYKQGRSTLREGTLLKLKPEDHAEAVVTGFEPLYRNHNEQTKSELGFAKRSTSQEGKVADDLLGTLRVRDLKTGAEFSIGGGFTHAQRNELWADRENLIGRIARYKYCPIGIQDNVPRFPVWTGWRHPDDLS